MATEVHVKKIEETEKTTEHDDPYSSVNFKMKYSNEKIHLFCSKKNIEFQGKWYKNLIIRNQPDTDS